MTYDNLDEINEELFETFLSKYQIGLENKMRQSDFISDCGNFLSSKCHKMNF